MADERRAQPRLVELLATRREFLVDQWTARVLADPAVPEANRLSAPALRHHVPGYIDRLIDALLRRGARETGESTGRALGSGWVAVAHARGRYDQNYSLAAALRELSHFRAVFIEFCWSERVDVDARDAQLVHAMIDETMATVAVEIDRAARAELDREAEFRERCIGIVGHDLRNPLQAVTVATELMRMDRDLPQRAQKALGRIASSAARMGRIISDLLDFAHGRLAGGIPLTPGPTDLAAVCRQVVEELEVGSDRRIVLLADDATSGIWDADRLAQVISNLVGNALRHGNPHAPVRVSVRPDGDNVRIDVHNEGPPIPRELLPKIFEPFRRAADSDRSDVGLGLGLFIAERIVAAHSGAIDVDSREAAGTTFTVTLPRSSPPS
jgi:signal transduction histidine kinase